MILDKSLSDRDYDLVYTYPSFEGVDVLLAIKITGLDWQKNPIKLNVGHFNALIKAIEAFRDCSTIAVPGA